jgi:hypothetical protein
MESPESRWSRWERAFRDGAREALKAWLRGSRVEGEGAPVLAPGSIASDVDLHRTALMESMRRGVPRHVSAAFAGSFAEGWDGWFSGYRAMLVVREPSEEDGRAGNAPLPLRSGRSDRAVLLTSHAIAEGVKRRLAQLGWEAGAAEAADAFAAWLAKRFDLWLDRAMIQGVSIDVETGAYRSRRGLLTDLGLFEG